MTTNHTPGPWTFRPDSSKHGEFVVGPANSTPTASNVVAFAVLPHNAPLIAAAPDLLMVLERLISDFHDEGRSIQPGSPIWEALHKVVAKAKGGSNA